MILIGIGYIGCMISFFSIYLPIVYIHIYIYIPQIFTELMPQISEVVMATAGLFLELAKGAHCDIAKLPGSQLVEWSTTVYIFFLMKLSHTHTHIYVYIVYKKH